MKRFVFNMYSWLALLAAVLLTTGGYVVMAQGDRTVSPIMLIIAYLVAFPLAIVIGWLTRNKTND